jgi:hypothetical protein
MSAKLSPRRNSLLAKKTAQKLEAWRDEIAQRTAILALQEMTARAEAPGLGLNRADWDQRFDDWIAPLVQAAQRIGDEAAKQAFEGLMKAGLPAELASLARSHAGRKANDEVKQHKGGRPAIWRANVEKKILSNKRFMAKNPSNQEIIDKAVDLGIIDTANRTSDPDTAYYFDYETEAQIAKNKKNMIAEISRIKSKFLQKK